MTFPALFFKTSLGLIIAAIVIAVVLYALIQPSSVAAMVLFGAILFGLVVLAIIKVVHLGQQRHQSSTFVSAYSPTSRRR